jgi:hypothetical protein
MIKRVLTLDNVLKITPRISINDAAGPEAGPVWRSVVQPHRPSVLSKAEVQCRRRGKQEKASASRYRSWGATRSGGGGDQRPPRLVHVGADLVCLDGRRRKRVLVKIIGE